MNNAAQSTCVQQVRVQHFKQNSHPKLQNLIYLPQLPAEFGKMSCKKLVPSSFVSYTKDICPNVNNLSKE